MKFDYRTPLADYPSIWFCIRCWDCDFAVDLRLTDLVIRFGGEVPIDDVMMWAARDCCRAGLGWNDGNPCAAYLPLTLSERPPKVRGL